MSDTMVDVMLHIDEALTHSDLDSLRENILQLNGVMAASFHDDKPHLMIIEYDPEVVNSSKFIEIVKSQGANAELVGL